MKKPITLNDITYIVDTEKEIPPGKWYWHRSPNTISHWTHSFPFSNEYGLAGLILSCNNAAEAARLGVPVTEPQQGEKESGTEGKKLLIDFARWYNDYIDKAYSITEEDIDKFLSRSQQHKQA